MSNAENTIETNKNDAPILQVVKNEHKYTLMLLSVLRDQLAEFDIGKTPDYQLMLDTMRYISDFPERFNHPAKNALIQAIINKNSESNDVLETLLAEKRQIPSRSKEVIRALKALIKEESILKEEQLKIFCKNFVELLESHIETESQLLFSQARSLLSANELAAFQSSPLVDEEQALASIIEERYKNLSKELNKHWDDLEVAANDFALAEFIGMSALFESIQPFSVGLGAISHIIKDVSYRLYLENYQCYKELFSKRHKSIDYIDKPTACLVSCYKEYVASIEQIKNVFNETKQNITDPYEKDKEILNEVLRSKKSKRV